MLACLGGGYAEQNNTKTNIVRGKKGAELYETKRRQQKLLISNNLREAGRNPPQIAVIN
jgi:hypothetical protein